MIPFAPRCLQPPVTLAPVRRGEGGGEGSVDESERSTLAGAPLTLTLSPEDGGEGIGVGRPAAFSWGFVNRLPLSTACLVTVTLLAAAAPRARRRLCLGRVRRRAGQRRRHQPDRAVLQPGGHRLRRGPRPIYLDGVLAVRRGSFTHAPAATDVPEPPGAEGANSGRARFFNVFGAPMLGATTRLRDLAVGAAFSVPFGGRLRWDRNNRSAGDPRFPLAADGPQRWTVIDGALSYLYFTLGAAYRLGPLSVGVSGNLVRSSIHQSQAKNPTGLGDPDVSNEGRDILDVAGTQGSFGAGALLEAIRDRLWLGLSYQAQPGLGPMTLRGTLVIDYQGTRSPFPVTLSQALPDIIRFGARYRAGPALELRLFGDVTRWSRFGTQCVALAGHPCAVFASGADATPDAATVQNLRRLWHDTYAVRAGASTWLRPGLELFAGLGFETAATPDATLDSEPARRPQRADRAGRAGFGHPRAAGLRLVRRAVVLRARQHRTKPAGRRATADPARRRRRPLHPVAGAGKPGPGAAVLERAPPPAPSSPVPLPS